jgi:hypothetical protein
MKCPKCGHVLRGRPHVVDDTKVQAMIKEGWSIAAIGRKFGVTRAAIQYSIRRNKK